jgi:hypothetical protein
MSFRALRRGRLVPAPARRRLGLCLLALLAASALAGQEVAPGAPEPGSELTAYLLTMAPGDEVWERFGHNALWISDARRGTEIAYAWGFFDFRQADFLTRFFKGRMQYMMAGQNAARTVSAHRERNRSVTAQELNLTPAQRRELQELLERNARPENAFYRYDYFLDNCSTRLRDALDRVLDGQLRAAVAGRAEGRSYRYHTRRLTEVDKLLYLGMDTLLGSRGDHPISVWEEMFVPMVVRDEVRDLRIRTPGGTKVSLVRSERVLFAAGREPEPEAPHRFLLVLSIIGLGSGGLVAGLARLGARAGPIGRLGRLAFLLIAGGWCLLVGLVGLILVLCLFTDHPFIQWNENLFHTNPLALGLLVLLPAAVFGRRSRLAGRLSQLLAALAVLGFALQALPGLDQSNGPTIALTLPVHLALAWTLAAGRAPADAPKSA